MTRLATPFVILSGIGLAFALAATSCGSDALHVSGAAGSAAAGSAADGGSTAGSGADGGSTSPGGASDAGADSNAAGQAGAATDLTSLLGSACTSDSDCRSSDLICVRASHDFGAGIGAPPGGVCTAQCQADAECKKLAPGAVCAAMSEAPLDLDAPSDPAEPRFCMAGCALGAPAGPTKCHGRAAFACRPFAPPDAQRCATQAPFCPDSGFCFRGYCRELGCGPRCEGDTDCESGRHCDPSSGLCVLGAVAPTPIGAPCDPDADTTPCENGRCLVLFDQNNVKTGSFCTQSCVLGDACGDGHGACELPRFADYEVGDIGYCQATCQCDGDCQVPGDGCISWGSSERAKQFASAGVCDHLSDPQMATLSCSGDGGSAGAQ